MSFAFNPKDRLIFVEAEIEGKTKNAILRLALDTGATGTVISAAKLDVIGYDLSEPEDESFITTGSGVISVPKIILMKITALGKEKENFLIIAHDLPPTASVDGVLVLDFLHNHVLTIDFKVGKITFE